MRVTARTLAALAAAVAIMFGLAPAAGSEGVTTAPHYRTFRAQLPTGAQPVVRWDPCLPITYQVNLAALADTRKAAALADTRKAVDIVAAATGLTFTYAGQTTRVPQPDNASDQPVDLVIAFTDQQHTRYELGDGVVGVGGAVKRRLMRPTLAGFKYRMAATHGFVVLDTEALASLTKPGFGPGRRRGNVLLHELGHVIGLDHYNEAPSMMNSVLNERTPNGFTSGDLAGLRRLGAASGCVVPKHARWASTR